MCCICCYFLRGLSRHLIWCRLHLLAPNEEPHCYWRNRNSDRRLGQWRWHAPTWNKQELEWVEFSRNFFFGHSHIIVSRLAATAQNFAWECPPGPWSSSMISLQRFEWCRWRGGPERRKWCFPEGHCSCLFLPYIVNIAHPPKPARFLIPWISMPHHFLEWKSG